MASKLITEKNLIMVQLLVGLATVVVLTYQIRQFMRAEKRLQENESLNS